MINYHYLKVDSHIRHHKNVKTNYGPDWMDVLIGTKQDNSKFEDMSWTILNSIISMIILYIYNKKLIKI